MATLGELERTVMDVLWETEKSVNANELRELLLERSRPSKDLAVTTVLTVLSRLEKKGLVVREREIRPHAYRAVTSRAEHSADLMVEALGQAPDREAVLARFVGTVTDDEAEVLRKLLGGH